MAVKCLKYKQKNHGIYGLINKYIIVIFIKIILVLKRLFKVNDGI